VLGVINSKKDFKESEKLEKEILENLRKVK